MSERNEVSRFPTVTTGINMDKVMKLLEIEKRGIGGNTINIPALINQKAAELQIKPAAGGQHEVSNSRRRARRHLSPRSRLRR